MLNLKAHRAWVKQKHDPKNTFVNKDDRNDVVDESSIARVGDRPVEMNAYTAATIQYVLKTNLFKVGVPLKDKHGAALKKKDVIVTPAGKHLNQILY